LAIATPKELIVLKDIQKKISSRKFNPIEAFYEDLQEKLEDIIFKNTQ
jgi:hypothetical protein